MMPKEQTIIDKVRKLLTLARHERTGEIEATNASNRARVLLAEYNLDMAIIDQPEEDPVTEELYHHGRLQKWQRILLNQVTRSCFCRSLQIVNGKGLDDWVIVGKPHNIAVARETVLYLTAAINRLAKEHTGEGQAYLNSFKFGCSFRICQRLEEKRQASMLHGVNTPETRMPALLNLYQTELAEVERHIRQSTEDVKKARIKATVSDTRAFRKGLEAGDRVGLDPQLNKQARQQTYQIGVSHV